MEGYKKWLGLTRLGLGLIFLWAFFDKLIGLGFTTCRDEETNTVITFCERAWLSGGSPTTGFLKFATQGPFEGFYQSLAGNVFVDWLFMLGLLGIGVALTLGILVKFASWSGALMMLLMYLAVLPPEHHPFIDDHIIYALVLIAFTSMPVGDWVGMGNWWKTTGPGRGKPMFH